MKLSEFFEDHTQVAVAFSGGVDSAYLLYAAKKYAKEVQAYYVKSAFQPQFELEDAMRLASELEVKMKVIPLDILSEEIVVSNPKNRCYYCKKQIFSLIMSQAENDGFSVLLDGTNASDEEKERPGMVALQELFVLSPLRLCGLTKSKIRILSKEANLFTWNKPSYACLATRIPTGQWIEERLLLRTERAENYLSALGFVNFRVRTVGENAKIQVMEKQLPLLIKHRKEIQKQLAAEYQSVFFDLEVRDEE